MANDIDLWHDIELLEKEGKTKQAQKLMAVYQARYIQYNIPIFKTLKAEYEKEYGKIGI